MAQLEVWFGEGENEKSYFFFFQAEDGIRDGTVTGVQTCALPIWSRAGAAGQHRTADRRARGAAARRAVRGADAEPPDPPEDRGSEAEGLRRRPLRQIGRASCRERVEIGVGAVTYKEKMRRGDCQQ